MKLKVVIVILAALAASSACSTGAGTSATPLPTVVLDGGTAAPGPGDSGPSSGGGITASAIIVPVQEVRLAFTSGGRVRSVNVAIGDRVRSGKILAELENASVQAEYGQAERALRDLSSPSAIAAAAQQVANAQKAVEDAQKKYDSLFFKRASDELLDHTKGEIDLTRQQLSRAADSYRKFSRLPDGDPRRAASIVALTEVQLKLNALNAQYNWYTGKPTETEAAITRANLDAAKAALQESQWYLAALKGESFPGNASGLDLARFENTRDALNAAQEKLNGTRLIAPFGGTVASVDLGAGDVVSPGEIRMVMIDSTRLRAETTDLSERDVAGVKVGQSVSVHIDALNADVSGTLLAISPLADTLGGDVVYKTIVELEENPEGLLAGMSATVHFEGN